ncbi:LANO_0D10066g1_1 [Lachancea nothofagi CBS 11611]|uniref:LANO_0D10066g1_1 n=1 Tax=Lachancea nothofagi CBS 11611 TaxID=1266666 RepID=A0A1G4JK18_9SACH|nr:LANO_0D10066g1_1 [Lachancea nothofagi CBS 11611]
MLFAAGFGAYDSDWSKVERRFGKRIYIDREKVRESRPQNPASKGPSFNTKSSQPITLILQDMSSGTGIMTLPAMACSAEHHHLEDRPAGSTTVSLPTTASVSAKLEAHSPPKIKPEASATPVALTPASSSTPSGSISCRRARNFWSVHEDTVLVSIIIDNTTFLRGPANTRPRSRFWLHISFELKVRHGLSRNKRQCRDRFNLLFWKAVRDHRSNRKDLKKLDSLLAQCLTLLYIDKNNVIMLKENRTSHGLVGGTATNSATSPLAQIANEETGLHSPARSELSPTMSSYSSTSESHDSNYETLAEMASALKQQVNTLTQRVEDLCGVIAMERSRIDFLVSSRSTRLDTPTTIYQQPMRLSQDPIFLNDSTNSLQCGISNGYVTTSQYMAGPSFSDNNNNTC